MNNNLEVHVDDIDAAYIEARKKLSKNLKDVLKGATPEQIVQAFGHDLALACYTRMIAFYRLKGNREEFKIFRQRVRDYLMLTLEKKYKNTEIVDKLIHQVIRPFERRFLIPRGLKLSGKVKDVHHKILDLFDEA